ncbi:MAG: Tol-Pal system protein TolB [Chlamydiae bacterium]|nr:Tol-Pal system protein TolB [Chlamydiota bacterium]
MIRLFTLLFIFYMGFLPSEEKEIPIHLHTRENLHLVYLGKIQNKQPFFSNDHLKQIRSVLHFDLNYNGVSKVLKIDENLEKWLQDADFRLSLNSDIWKDTSIEYVIKAEINHKTLSAFVFSIKDQTLKQFKEILLSGDLSQDRRQMHKLADAIQNSLFQKEGIAQSRILYSYQIHSNPSDPSLWKAEIWECDWDGANPKRLTYDESYSITPVQHPSSSSATPFLYVSYKVGQPKIYFSNGNEKKGKPLLDIRGNQILPAISPKKDKMAFICDASGRADLFIQAINREGMPIGKPIQLFSFPDSTQASPTFNPDGTKIAFVSDKDGTPRIYTIPAELDQGKRSQPTLISKANRENSCPNWSPDGTKIAYSAKTNGIRQIWIYDCTEKEERQLTFGPGNKENPCWAQDSLHLVFNSTGDISSELYIANLNQPETIQITRGPGIKHYPSWIKK